MEIYLLKSLLTNIFGFHLASSLKYLAYAIHTKFTKIFNWDLLGKIVSVDAFFNYDKN
jgi:hypothetical protein